MTIEVTDSHLLPRVYLNHGLHTSLEGDLSKCWPFSNRSKLKQWQMEVDWIYVQIKQILTFSKDLDYTRFRFKLHEWIKNIELLKSIKPAPDRFYNILIGFWVNQSCKKKFSHFCIILKFLTRNQFWKLLNVANGCSAFKTNAFKRLSWRIGNKMLGILIVLMHFLTFFASPTFNEEIMRALTPK